MLEVGSRNLETRHSYHSTANRSSWTQWAAQAVQLNRLRNRRAQNFDAGGSSGAGADSGGQVSPTGSPDSDNGVAVSASSRQLDSRQVGHRLTGAAASPEANATSVNQLALLYAIFLTLLGLIFPLSYYVSTHPLSKWYLICFYIIVDGVGIAFLVFYMGWVMTRPPQKLFLEGPSVESGELVRLQDSERPTGKVQFQVGRFSVSESSPNFKDVEQDGEDCYSNEGYDDEEEAPAANGFPKIQLQEPEDALPEATTSTADTKVAVQRSGVTFDALSTQCSHNGVAGPPRRMKRINSTLIRHARELGVHEIQAYSVLSLHESHSPSFFLRVACFLFGGLKITHEALHIVDTVTSVGAGCGDSASGGEVVQYVLSIVFTLLQTFFIFKYSKVSVNIHQRVSVFGFMHLVATNLCVWFNAILLETSHNAHLNAHSDTHSDTHSDSYAHKAANYSSSPTVSSGHGTSTSSSGSNCSKDVFWRMAPYLFPFTIEYSLMAAFSCYVLYCNVGKFLEVILTKGFNVGKKCLRNRKKSQTSFSASCYKSDKGFFLGAMQMIVGVVSGIYFIIYVNDTEYDQVVSKHIFLHTELALLTSNLVLCIIAYIRIRRLTLVHKMTTGPDSWLLGVTLMGVLAFEMFQLFGVSAEANYFLALRIAKGLMCILQSMFQVFLVLDGEKRRAKSPETIEQKPGREMIAALLLGNLALWVVYTLEVREINNLPSFNDAYVSIASEIFAYVCSPLIIFFRFHSACCFVEVWRHSYKGKSAKKECEEAASSSKDPETSSIHFAGSVANISETREASSV